MKLKDACEIAQNCNLDTVGEAVLNIRIHAPSLFSYDELSDELHELQEEVKQIADDMPVSEFLARFSIVPPK